jgi:hypothetical protein
VNPGFYCHIGLSSGIRHLWNSVVENVKTIELLIGIDGLPLFNSCPGEVWPIMASIVNRPSIFKKVWPVGIYYGKKKPADCRDFLKQFVEEALDLTTNGILTSGQKIFVTIKGFVCDAPTKAFILGIKSHTGYSSCTRCKQAGTWEYNKVVFTELDWQARANEEFLKRLDEDYCIGHTNLQLLPNIDFVYSFPIDYMHLACLCVTKTLLSIWNFARPPLKLSSHVLSSISSTLTSFRSSIPNEFCRKPRGVDEMKR